MPNLSYETYNPHSTINVDMVFKDGSCSVIGLELLQVVYNNASAFDKSLADNMLMLKIIVVLSLIYVCCPRSGLIDDVTKEKEERKWKMCLCVYWLWKL